MMTIMTMMIAATTKMMTWLQTQTQYGEGNNDNDDNGDFNDNDDNDDEDDDNDDNDDDNGDNDDDDDVAARRQRHKVERVYSDPGLAAGPNFFLCPRAKSFAIQLA